LFNGEIDGAVSGASFGSGNFDLFGSASDVTLLRSSLLALEGLAGPAATGTIVTNGAELELFFGVVSDSEVESGGKEFIQSGVGSGDTIGSGGLLEVLSGATLSDETVQRGGTFDFNGDVTGNLTLGAATSTTVLDGVTVASGGYIELGDATVQSGVTLSLGGTTTAAVVVDVNSGGVLRGPGDIAGGAVAGRSAM
jgi:autotransporter passenger strand-loop-strand repeat protein